jgi:hypothetical protein
LVAQGHVPDEVFEAVRQEFSEKEIVDLTAAAIAINSWNRIAIAFRVCRGSKQEAAAGLDLVARSLWKAGAGSLHTNVQQVQKSVRKKIINVTGSA